MLRGGRVSADHEWGNLVLDLEDIVNGRRVMWYSRGLRVEEVCVWFVVDMDREVV